MSPLLRFGLLGLAILCFSPVAAAEETQYGKARVNLGLIVPYGPGTRAVGGGLVLEPKYNVHDFLSVGLRLEAGAQLGGSLASSAASIRATASYAILAKGEFFLLDSTVRPFLGLGTGLYILAGQSLTAGAASGEVTQLAGTFFGVTPQVGIDFGRVRVAAGYNALIGQGATVQVALQNANPRRITRSYWSFELSFGLGGERKSSSTST